MSVITDLAQFLEDEGHGSRTSNPPTIQEEEWQETPDNAIGVFGFNGPGAEKGMGNVRAWQDFNVQIQVRNNNPVTAENLCETIWAKLDGPNLINKTINGTVYQQSRGKLAPGKLTTDDDLRTIYYCEIEVRREE